MALDPSIILQGQNKLVDPMQTASQALSLKNALLQNQGAQQEFNARRAIGPIYQASIDPATGKLDTNKLLANAAGNPDAAWMAGDLAKAGLDREKTQADIASTGVDIDTKKYALLKSHIGSLQQAMAPLIANPNATPSDYINSAAHLVSQGLIKPDEAMQALQGMPQDSAQLHAWGIGQYSQLLDTDKQLDIYYGKAQQTDTGNGIQQGTESAVTGYHPQGTFTKGMSPSDAAGTVATVGPNGEPGVISKAAFASQAGIPQGGAYVPVNGQPMSSAQPAPQTPPGGAQVASNGFMPTGLAPGQAKLAEANADRASTIQNYALTAPSRIAALHNIATAIPTLPDQAFGPTGRITTQMGGWLTSLGVADPKVTSGQASIDEVNKALAQVASQQGKEMGAGTDASRAIVHDANPNLGNSREGFKTNVAIVTGNEQFAVAKNRALQEYLQSHPASNATDFETKFNANVSPLVFQVQGMGPEAKKRVWDGLKGTQAKDGSWTGEKGKFLRAVDFAESHGWFDGQ